MYLPQRYHIQSHVSEAYEVILFAKLHLIYGILASTHNVDLKYIQKVIRE